MSEILLYGSIGIDFWDPDEAITAKTVMNQLAEIDGDVTVRISSGGGDVYEGIDIMNALKNHDGYVTVIVESLAASAASFIAVGAADKVLMRDTSEMMVHKAWSWFEGNADEVRSGLADLDRQDVKLAKIYAGKAGGDPDEWLERMSAETWYTAQEAVDAGLADGLVDVPAPAAARAVSSLQASRKRFKYPSRAAAPAPPRARRSGSAAHNSNNLGVNAMNIAANLEKAINKNPRGFAHAIAGFLNETVEVNGTVEVTYPEATIAPTEKITVEPIIGEGEGAAGLTFAMGDVAEGYTAEVDEAGTVTITAPSGVEPEDTAAFTVKVNDVDVALTVTVKAVSGDGEETGGAPAPVNPASPAPVGDTVTLDAETFADLQAAAKHGWAAQEREREAGLVAEVDQWIKDGRINARLRAKAIDAIKRDADSARAVYGGNPKGSIPRREIGHGVDPDEPGKVSASAPSPFAKPRI